MKNVTVLQGPNEAKYHFSYINQGERFLIVFRHIDRDNQAKGEKNHHE